MLRENITQFQFRQDTIHVPAVYFLFPYNVKRNLTDAFFPVYPEKTSLFIRLPFGR